MHAIVVKVTINDPDAAATTARALADQMQPPGDFVTFDSVEVGEVVASA